MNAILIGKKRREHKKLEEKFVKKVEEITKEKKQN